MATAPGVIGDEPPTFQPADGLFESRRTVFER
jgi:hypothetical protein